MRQVLDEKLTSIKALDAQVIKLLEDEAVVEGIEWADGFKELISAQNPLAPATMLNPAAPTFTLTPTSTSLYMGSSKAVLLQTASLQPQEPFIILETQTNSR